MELLLTILSVLAFWAFLTVLIAGLLMIFKTLDAVKGNLERIAMGVRAIERQTVPFESYVTTLTSKLHGAGERVRGAARSLQNVADNADAIDLLSRRS